MSTPASPLSVQDFAGKLRAKYPGAYDNIADVDLVQKVVAKYPQYSQALDKEGQSVVAAPNANQRARATGAGMQPSAAALALSNSPSGADPQNPGNPNLNAIPESERGKVNSAALATQATALAGEGFSSAIPKGLSAINSALKYLGIGEKAAPEAEQIATGIFDQYGDPIMKTLEPEAKNAVNKIISHPKVQDAIKEAAKVSARGLLSWEAGKYGSRVIEELLK